MNNKKIDLEAFLKGNDKMIETLKEYDIVITVLIDEGGQDSKEVIKAVDKVTNFEKLETDLEKIIQIKKGQKILALGNVGGDDHFESSHQEIRVYTVKRLRVAHYAFGQSVIKIQTEENFLGSDWGIPYESCYTFERLSKMLGTKNEY